ncbi:diadenylate cyclase [Oligoflexus tunisiensis]|uniref:diadenylate cyclase n=1 Tax=Oligoflexus tunisiensis TaxID=708132 RepID=UPI000A616B29|nr:diadenylate cyclase [Oligoflexus tunisiensis]
MELEIKQKGRGRVRKSDEFLNIVRGFDDLVFVTHDNPDPDGVACGWALGELVRRKLGKNYRLVARGTVLRAENQQLLKLLHPPLELVEDLAFSPATLAVLIDCRPEALNHLPLDHATIAVIDHHRGSQPRSSSPIFSDLRTQVAASASIAACYWREHELPLPPELATALAYAIRSECGGGSVTFSTLDRRMFNWVSRYAQADVLTEIEEAPLPRAYFRDLTHALQSTRLVQGMAFCMLPSVAAPETVGEVADLLIRCQGIEAALCAGRNGEKILLSSRTHRESRKDASHLVHKVVEGLGHSGGHEHRAGGLIPLHHGDHQDDQLASDIQKRWFLACGVAGESEESLVEATASMPSSPHPGGSRAPAHGRDVPFKQKAMNLLLHEADLIAAQSDAKAVFILSDPEAFPTPWDCIQPSHRRIFYGIKESCPAVTPTLRPDVTVIRIPNVPLTRMNQVKLVVFLALARRLIAVGDVVVCLAGAGDGSELDTLFVARVGHETEMFSYLPCDKAMGFAIRPEVIARVVDLAIELGVEGREGKPVGALFVLGDAPHVMRKSRPLILNPFFGYKEEQRNILDPHLEETVKELSTIDGAFIVREDGVIESCGVFLKVSGRSMELPSGLGSRHHVAAGITATTDSIAITVSESTGTVTIFRRGKILTVMEKPRRLSCVVRTLPETGLQA